MLSGIVIPSQGSYNLLQSEKNVVRNSIKTMSASVSPAARPPTNIPPSYEKFYTVNYNVMVPHPQLYKTMGIQDKI